MVHIRQDTAEPVEQDFVCENLNRTTPTTLQKHLILLCERVERKRVRGCRGVHILRTAVNV